MRIILHGRARGTPDGAGRLTSVGSRHCATFVIFDESADSLVSNSDDKSPDTPPSHTPLFRPRATTIFRVAILGVLLATVAIASGVLQYFHSPYWNRVGLAPDQPV